MGKGRGVFLAVILLVVSGCGGIRSGAPGADAAPGLKPPLGAPLVDAKRLPAVDARLASFDVTLKGAFNGTVHQELTGTCGVDAHGDVGDQTVRSSTFLIGKDVFSVDVLVRPRGTQGRVVERSDEESRRIQTDSPKTPVVYVDLARLVLAGGVTRAAVQWHAAPGTVVDIGPDSGSAAADMLFWPGSGSTQDPHQNVHLDLKWHCQPRPAGSLPTISVATSGYLNGTYRAQGVELDWCGAGARRGYSSGLIEVGDKTYLFWAAPDGTRTSGSFPLVDAAPSPTPGVGQASFYLLNSNEELFKLKPGALLTISSDHGSGVLKADLVRTDADGSAKSDMHFEATMTCGRAG